MTAWGSGSSPTGPSCGTPPWARSGWEPTAPSPWTRPTATSSGGHGARARTARTRGPSAFAAQPVPTFHPFLGDYARVVSVGSDFYGVFSGSNFPRKANFPSGVTYQRNVDWDAHTLLDLDGTTPVPESIDPFFFHWSA